MPTVGEQLRQAREEQRLSVYQVAEITKIRTDHIRALEAGHYEVFSAPVYIRGFVRTYARVLKLDDAALVAALNEELQAHDRLREPPALVPPHGSAFDRFTLQLAKMNWRLLIALLVVVGLLMLGWKGYQRTRAVWKSDPLKRLGPGLYEPSNGPPGDVLPLPDPRRLNSPSQ